MGKLRYMDKGMTIDEANIGPLTQKLYDTITSIQTDRIAGEFGWRVITANPLSRKARKGVTHGTVLIGRLIPGPMSARFPQPRPVCKDWR